MRFKRESKPAAVAAAVGPQRPLCLVLTCDEAPVDAIHGWQLCTSHLAERRSPVNA